jgi:hypothetical protein
MPAGGVIAHLTTMCGGNVHEEAPMTSARDVAFFPGSVAKTLDTIKQKSYGYLASGGSQARKVDFTHCSGIFRLRGGSSTSEDSLKATVPRKYVFMPDGVHLVALDFAEDCQGKVETFLRIKQQIKTRSADDTVGIRLDIGSGCVAIPVDSNWMLVLYSSAESLRIPDWIKVIRANDLCFCPNLRKVIAGQQREIDGFRNCRKLEQVELFRSVEVLGREAFSTDEDEGGRSGETGRARMPLFLTIGDELWLRRRRRGCHVFITGKVPEKKKNSQVALSGVIRT